MTNNYILFDGECGFCNKTIMLIAKNDTNNQFIFVSSLSEFGNKLLTQNNIIGLEQETIIFFENNIKTYIKSNAIRRILIKIPKFKFVSFLMYLLPKSLMDFLYMAISKRRKSIVKSKNCKIPSLEIRQKFILE